LALKQRWVLTQDAFDGLLARFDEDTRRAAEKYELVRAELVRLFRYRGCTAPHELADQTIDRVARKIAEGEVIPRGEMSNYFYGIARNILKEYFRRPDASASPIDELPLSAHPAKDPEEFAELSETWSAAEQRFRCLEKCIDKLPPETRKLVVEYYEKEEGAKIENRRKLAEQMGISLNSLRIRLHRIRDKIEKCLFECIRNEDQG
jgi:RNA polymerase sigma factor (sigma-70 family)